MPPQSAARSRVTVQSGRERSRGGAPGGERVPHRDARVARRGQTAGAPPGAPPPLAFLRGRRLPKPRTRNAPRERLSA